jgi:hypothetical protein
MMDTSNGFADQQQRGVGRVRIGRRILGCVGYTLEHTPATSSVVKFDPMPDSVKGDVLQLILEDGRILDCRVIDEHDGYCAVVDDAQLERRKSRRPPSTTRAFQ